MAEFIKELSDSELEEFLSFSKPYLNNVDHNFVRSNFPSLEIDLYVGTTPCNKSKIFWVIDTFFVQDDTLNNNIFKLSINLKLFKAYLKHHTHHIGNKKKLETTASNIQILYLMYSLIHKKKLFYINGNKNYIEDSVTNENFKLVQDPEEFLSFANRIVRRED
jgi:hypothetical protein